MARRMVEAAPPRREGPGQVAFPESQDGRAIARRLSEERTARGALEFFGDIYGEHGESFFRSHEQAYRDFLERERLEDTEQVRRQWSAVMMAYALGRYGGSLRVNYKGIHERDDIRVTEGSETTVRRTEMTGTTRTILRDILAGTRFTDPRSGDGYNSFGDCDEIALLLAQIMQGMSRENGLSLDPMIYRVERGHAYVAFMIGGQRYVLDPSKGSLEYPQSLRRMYRRVLAREGTAQYTREAVRRSLRRMREEERPLPLYDDRYQRNIAPRYDAMLAGDPTMLPGWGSLTGRQRAAARRALEIPRISPGQQGFVELAATEVSMPRMSGQVELQKEIRRRAWRHAPDADIYRIIRRDFLPDALGMPEGRQMAIGMLVDFIAASARGGFQENRERIWAAFGEMGQDAQLSAVRRLVRMVEGRRGRPSMAEVERTIRRS